MSEDPELKEEYIGKDIIYVKRKTSITQNPRQGKVLGWF
jgi:ribosomal protein L35AE/L33A